MRKLDVFSEKVYQGKDYVFEYSAPLLNPIVNNEGLRSFLNLNSQNTFWVSEVKVFGSIKLNIRFSNTYWIKEIARFIDDLIDQELWGNTDFIAAYEGNYSYAGVIQDTIKETGETAATIAGGLADKLKGMLIPIAIIGVVGLVFWSIVRK